MAPVPLALAYGSSQGLREVKRPGICAAGELHLERYVTKAHIVKGVSVAERSAGPIVAKGPEAAEITAWMRLHENNPERRREIQHSINSPHLLLSHLCKSIGV
ncbi:hypothetical protein ACVWY0_004242 [Arthrobacter sp. UYNi723]